MEVTMKIFNKKNALICSIVFAMLVANDAVCMTHLHATNESSEKGNGGDSNVFALEAEKEVPTFAKHDEEEGTHTAIPSTFDLRTLHKVTPVKNQTPWDAVSTFGVIASLESNALMRNKEMTTPDYSELQLAWNYYEKQTKESLKSNHRSFGQIGEGMEISKTGNGRLQVGTRTPYAISLLAAWQGAANEVDVPYLAQDGSLDKTKDWTVPTNKRNAAAIQLQHALYLPKPVTLKYTDKLTYEFRADAVLDMKKAIMKEGALSIEHHADKPNGSYFNIENAALYVSDFNHLTLANHNASIIGWDDQFAADKFHVDNRPQGDGAWLVKNSKGDTWGQQGYFWLSYYDRTITQILSLQTQPTTTYDNNYQYDFLGIASNGQLAKGSDGEERIANVFTVDADEQLQAVSATTAAPNTTVHTQVYKLEHATSKPIPAGAAPVSSQRDSFQYAGYHTIALKEAVALKKGETFSVVQTITHVKDGKQMYQLPVEIGNKNRNETAVINRHESYIIDNNKQTDLYDIREASTGNSLNIGNAMIKAFTVKSLVLTQGDVTIRDYYHHLAPNTQLTVNEMHSGSAFDTIKDALVPLGGSDHFIIRNIALQPGLGSNQKVNVSIALDSTFTKPEHTVLYYANISEGKANLITIEDIAKDPRVISGDVSNMGYYVISEVKKRPPLPQLANITYDPTQTLASIIIPYEGHGTWTWEKPTMVPTTDVTSYTAVFKPNAGSEYSSYKANIPLITEKANVSIISNATPITYGQTLADSIVTGEASLGDRSVDGTFTWTEATILPTVNDALNEYMVVFTPTDAINYNAAFIKQKVDVTKKAISIIVNDEVKFYGDPNPEFTFTLPQGELIGKDTTTVLKASLSSNTDENTNVGNYTIEGFANADNYTVTVVEGTLEIKHHPLREKKDLIHPSMPVSTVPNNVQNQTSNFVNKGPNTGDAIAILPLLTLLFGSLLSIVIGIVIRKRAKAEENTQA